MSKRLIRTYKKLDIKNIQKYLVVYGDLSANCWNCNEINIKLNMPKCPSCETEFKYIAFRNVRTNLPKISKLYEERPSLTIIDLEDYKKSLATLKAEAFLK